MIANIDEKLSALGYLAVATAMLYALVVTAPFYVAYRGVVALLRRGDTTEERSETRRSAVS